MTFPDGNRDLVLHYVSHTIRNDGFVVTLKDISREVFVELHYSVDAATGVLGRSAVIVNRTKAPLTIEQAAAASWNLPAGNDYRLRYLSGRWAAEWTLNEQKVAPGRLCWRADEDRPATRTVPGLRLSAVSHEMRRRVKCGSARRRGADRGASALSRTSCDRFA